MSFPNYYSKDFKAPLDAPAFLTLLKWSQAKVLSEPPTFFLHLWTKAELHAITKDFPIHKEDPIGFLQEFLLTVQTYEPGFLDLYQLIYLLVREGLTKNGWY